MPPYRPLRDWWYVSTLVEFSQRGDSLASAALGWGKDPAQYYRFVVRVTGKRWSELKQSGLCWVRCAAIAVWSPFLGNNGRF